MTTTKLQRKDQYYTNDGCNFNYSKQTFNVRFSITLMTAKILISVTKPSTRGSELH